MSTQVQTTLRGPEAFGLARKALEERARAGVWATPRTLEPWRHFLC